MLSFNQKNTVLFSIRANSKWIFHTFSMRVITSSWFLQYGAYTFFMSSARQVKHVPEIEI